MLDEAMELGRAITARPVPAPVANKQLLLHPRLDQVRPARDRGLRVFAGLLGGPANREAMAAFQRRREPDFSNLAVG